MGNVCRRFLSDDEDPYYKVKDWFGAIVMLPGGKVMGRPTTRITSYVDKENQMPEPSDPDLKFCPAGTIATPTASVLFPFPIQNPLNPMGCRQQMVWREIDLSLSRLDPFDYNLDLEGMWWAPHTGSSILYDVFDKVSLYVHHSERRPSPCVTQGGSLPKWPASGLKQTFDENYLDQSTPVMAFDAQWFEIKDSLAVYPPKPPPPNNYIKYLPLPAFRKPYLVYRDERDLRRGGGQTEPVISPFLTRFSTLFGIPNFTGSAKNGLPTIALPLLTDFFVWPDDPAVRGKCTGLNGWQIALSVQSARTPYFRAYTAGGYNSFKKPVYIDPSKQKKANGGFGPRGGATPGQDNSVYWARFDFLKRLSVMTFGFVKIHDPNKCKTWVPRKDKRLGNFPADAKPVLFDVVFEPLLSKLAQGTRIIPEFRSAESEALFSNSNQMLDPRAAWEAHIAVDDLASAAYFKNCSNYFPSPNDLLNKKKLKDVKGNPMDPSKVKYFNWRLIFINNVDVTPPVAPVLDSIGIVYRFDK